MSVGEALDRENAFSQEEGTVLTEKQQQVFIERHQALKAKIDEIKRRSEETAARAREVAGPYGVLLDGDTFEPLRAATEAEVAASIATATEYDPVGSITVEGREVFAVPPWLLK